MQSNLIYAELLKKVKNYSDNELKNISLKYLYLKFNLSSSDLLINKTVPWNKKTQEEFKIDIKKLTNKIPVQHITSSEFFYDRVFHVSDKTLIPRPETEELVDIIIKSEKSNHKKNILDIGTGSGCIILALKKIFPTSECFAIDLSNEAINVAKENAAALNLEINFTVDDVFNVDLKNQFDLIVSNPPYITLEERKNMSPNVLNHEPHSALFVYDKDPLLFYRSIAEIGLNNLNNNGKIYFEINEEYGHEVVSLLRELGYVNCMLIKDMQQKNRFVSAILK